MTRTRSGKLRADCLFFLLILYLFPAHSEAAVIVGPETSNLWLGKHLDIIRTDANSTDPDASIRGAFDHEAFRVDRDIPTFGYGQDYVYWARFTLENPTADAIPVFLVSRYAPIDRLTLYTPLGNKEWEALTLGDQVAFEKRPFAFRYPIYPITLKPGRSTFYLKMQTTSSAQLALTISAKDRFIQTEVIETLFLGMIFGSIVVMMFYNLFVYLKFHSRAYLLYVIYIFSYLAFSFNYQGLLQQFVFPKVDGATALNASIMVNIDLVLISAVTFSIEFLELKSRSRPFYWLNRGLQTLGILNICNTLFLGKFATQSTITSSFLMSFVLLGVGLVMTTKFRPARYYTLAWASVLTGNATLIAAGSGLIPQNIFTSWAQFVGASLEMLLLSLALADRVALIQEERSAIQKKLGIVLQNRVMLVSELAHKMNNPLNYIATGSAILRKNQLKHQKLFQILVDELASTRQESLHPERGEQLEHIAADNTDILTTIDNAIQKSALCIAEIRSLTGVDGFHKERLPLLVLIEAARLRIQESMGPGCLKDLETAAIEPAQTFVFANRFAFSLAFELIFRFWCKHPSKTGTLLLKSVEERNVAVDLLMFMHDPAGAIRRDLEADLLPQLHDLLAPYACELKTKAHDGQTEVIFAFLKPDATQGTHALVEPPRLKAA